MFKRHHPIEAVDEVMFPSIVQSLLAMTFDPTHIRHNPILQVGRHLGCDGPHTQNMAAAGGELNTERGAIFRATFRAILRTFV